MDENKIMDQIDLIIESIRENTYTSVELEELENEVQLLLNVIRQKNQIN